MKTNILVTSVGRRVSLIEAFIEVFNGVGQVHGTDLSPLAPALYFCHKKHSVPRIDDPTYIETLLEICKREEISGILSLIDPELALLGQHKKDFEDIGVAVIGSSDLECERWYDKYKSYDFCEKNRISMPRTYLNIDEFMRDYEKGHAKFPVILKPRWGSASIGIDRAEDLYSLVRLWRKRDDRIIQEYIEGTEFGIDVFVDMITGTLTDLFIKEKLLMRSGETDKSKSVINKDIEILIMDFVEKTNLRGVADIDVLKRGNEYFILEVNPRFGGGYPHAYGCGVNFPKYILENLQGKETEKSLTRYEDGILMMKYDQPLFMKEV